MYYIYFFENCKILNFFFYKDRTYCLKRFRSFIPACVYTEMVFTLKKIMFVHKHKL